MQQGVNVPLCLIVIQWEIIGLVAAHVCFMAPCGILFSSSAYFFYLTRVIPPMVIYWIIDSIASTPNKQIAYNGFCFLHYKQRLLSFNIKSVSADFL